MLTSTPHPKLSRPHTVTFDCWATLLYQPGFRSGANNRARQLARMVGAEVARAEAALVGAWRQHQLHWHRRQVFGPLEMIDHALRSLGVEATPERAARIVAALEPDMLATEAYAVPGARKALAALSRAGVRRALICDTGFAPGRVVRQLLHRQGLLELLEVTVFSDEIGVPKPHPAPFAAALAGLGVEACGAVHVGDLKRSDIAGARGSGMGSVRITTWHDDCGEGTGAGVVDCAMAGCDPPCARPEADAVVSSFAQLLRVVGHG